MESRTAETKRGADTVKQTEDSGGRRSEAGTEELTERHEKALGGTVAGVRGTIPRTETGDAAAVAGTIEGGTTRHLDRARPPATGTVDGEIETATEKGDTATTGTIVESVVCQAAEAGLAHLAAIADDAAGADSAVL